MFNKKFLKILLSASVFIFLSPCFSQNIPVTPPKGMHPRLLFTEKKLGEIKKNLSHPENEAAIKETELLLFEYFDRDVRFEQPKKKTFFWSGRLVAAIEASAFKYAVTDDKKYADWAYRTFINCCQSINLKGIYDDYRAYGQMMLTAAEIYDWCYDALSKKQKDELYSRAVSFAKRLQIGFPPEKGKAVTGHSAECQLLRAYLSCAIAMYDEHKDLWEMSASRFYKEFVPARKYFYESHTPNFQGSGYGPYRSIFDLWAAAMITAMGKADPFDGKLSLWSRYFIYTIRPDGMCWHIGDDHSIEKMNYNSFRYGTNAFLQTALSKDSYIKFFARENLGDFKKFKYNENGENDELLTPVQFLILNDVNVVSEDYRKLKPVYYCPSPLGEYFAYSTLKKDGETDFSVPAAGVHLKIGELTQANHEHQDAGSFEIYCNGLLASTAGFYVSGGGYRSDHTQKFYHASISKNTLLIQTDKNTYEGYGLQRALPEAKTFEQLFTEKKYQRAEVTAHYDDGGIIFLSGDISNAYEGNGFVHRSMLAFFTGDIKKPLVFFVYDQADTEGKAVFLLNSLKEPEVKENTVRIKNMEEKTGLINTVLFPQNPEIVKTGGQGHEWEIAGRNYSEGSEKAVTPKSESGWGRVEITTKDKGQSAKEMQTLLNVMEIYADEGQQSSSALIRTEKIDFAVCEKVAAGFYRPLNSKNNKEDYTLNLPAFQKNTRIILTNLPAGEWTVNGKKYKVDAESRILVIDFDRL